MTIKSNLGLESPSSQFKKADKSGAKIALILGEEELLNDKISFKDLRIKSPYNTYVNRGLPPGPIVTPDISAIEAVLNPMDHSFIYFVADVSNPGYHLFSRTNAEHNQNKRQYTKWLRERNIRR